MSWRQTKQGFDSFAKVTLASPTEKLALIGEIGNSAGRYLMNLPNMSAEDIGYDVGYTGEQIGADILIGEAAMGGAKMISMPARRFAGELFSYKLNNGFGLKVGENLQVFYGSLDGIAKTPFAYASETTILRIERGVIQDGGEAVWHVHYSKMKPGMSKRAFQKVGKIHRDWRPGNFGNPIGHNKL
jgi:hypothetical protein